MKPSNADKPPLKARADALRVELPAVFLAMRDRQTPWYAKALGGLTLVYALSPVDLIPDFIPGLGLLDDLIILPALAALTLKLLPEEVMARCREKSRGMWAQGKPKKWYYALPFIAVWALIVFLIVKAIWL